MEEELKKMLGKRPDELEGETLKLFNAIMKIADERDELKEKNKELEEENRIFTLEGSRVRLKMYIDKNYIPVSLVEEKIEELNKTYEDSKDENGESEYYYPDYTISVLQELLEKRK